VQFNEIICAFVVVVLFSCLIAEEIEGSFEHDFENGREYSEPLPKNLQSNLSELGFD